MITNCGIAESCAGTMKMTISSANSTPRPGNWNFANTNAASESKNSTSTVTLHATSSEFPIDPKKSIESRRWRTFSPKCEPGSSFGG